MMSITNINEIAAFLDLTRPYTYSVQFPKLTTNTSAATVELNIGDKDLWVTNLNVSSYDDSNSFAAVDKFSIKIQSIDGIALIDDPIDIYSLNTLGVNQLFKGWVLKARTKYTFTVTGQGIPTSAQFTNFIKFELDLMGYLLNNKA